MTGSFSVTLWGTRGSLASPGPETVEYGGNTSCVSVMGEDGTVLVLDAGTGIRRLGMALPPTLKRVDLLLTHLHMDHIQGLGFFRPMRTPGTDVHIWGPASTTQKLDARLSRYLSPPLFPVFLRELECNLHLHEVPCGDFQVGQFMISSALICHPDPSVGFRISAGGSTIAYLPDHEPALGSRDFSAPTDWISGSALVKDADLLIHDSQYTDEEYAERVGWGHSSLRQAVRFAELNGVKRLVTFHHDPSHSDADLDRMVREIVLELHPRLTIEPGREAASFQMPG